jgi:glutathione synthase/RimK-type ligase-like ATP-grasp enzyme
MMAIVGVFREVEFSPGRVEDDAAILERTASALAAGGFEVRLGSADLVATPDTIAVLAMCQSARSLAALDERATAVPVINTPQAIRSCYRTATARLLTAAGVLCPRTRIVPTSSANACDAAPCWVKRGDVHAMAAEDVLFAEDGAAVARALAAFAERGIARAAIQEHVEGAVVKFYGVADGSFFRCYSDAPEAPAPIAALWESARAGAAALGLEVFGGDLVVTPSGTPVLIDVNDWPSFARCREEAADAIATYVRDRLSAGSEGPRPAHGRQARI